jgi:branched-chain amino acid aminotransferase
METTAMPLIPVHRAYQSRLGEVDWEDLELGRIMTDHMLVCDYSKGAWKQAAIFPYGPFSLAPSTLAFHYGQTIFEGMKAFRTEDDRVHIFRPDKHYERLVRTTERMCMPVIPRELFIEGLRSLVDLERDWVPGQSDGALYIRPLQIATDTRLTVKVSESYRFAVICTPSGRYFPKPIRVKVERDFVRAASGGTGYAKCGGNYGGALYPTERAKAEGYDQVLWTDGRSHEYVEESGMMNVFFVMGGALVTPPLTDTILDGVTRDSLLALAADAGLRVEERPVSVTELRIGLASGHVSEAFGAGTGAVISPIATIGIDGVDFNLGSGSLGLMLKRELDDIRYGRKPDTYGWNYFV